MGFVALNPSYGAVMIAPMVGWVERPAKPAGRLSWSIIVPAVRNVSGLPKSTPAVVP